MEKNKVDKVAVCSRSFSRHPQLCEELKKRYENITFNSEGLSLRDQSLIEFLKGHSKAIIGLENLGENVLKALPELKVVSKYGVGIDSLDLKSLQAHKIQLGWTPGVNKRSVSELVIAMAISMLRELPQGFRAINNGEWKQRIGGLLSDRTVGIIGLGHIGQDLVGLLKPFACKVIANDIQDRSEFCKTWNVTPVSKDEVFKQADVVTVHTPLNSSTRHMVGEAQLKLMKPTAILINSARGGIVDEAALMKALKEQRIAGAALDVLEGEPEIDPDLLQLENLFISPHLGGSAAEAVWAMGMAAVVNLDKAKDISEFI